jgi:hypothetical protein
MLAATGRSVGGLRRAAFAAFLVLGAGCIAQAQDDSKSGGGPPVTKTRTVTLWKFESLKYQVALVELYTSQECESCPEVEATLNKLPSLELGFDKVAPLVFHVSYWPHLGWTDTLSSKEMNDHHKFVAAARGNKSPYTPQVFINGEEAYTRGTMLVDQLDRMSTRAAPVKLGVQVELWQDGKTVEIFGEADREAIVGKPHRDAFIQFAIIEMGIETKIEGGENKGKTLVQNYVVRRLLPEVDIRPTDVTTKMGYKPFQLDPKWNKDRLGIVGWVQVRETRQIIQAVGGLLEASKGRITKVPE